MFISYRHGAKPDRAHALAEHLKLRGCSVFIDDEIRAGVELPECLRAAINGAAVAVMVVTPGYFDEDRYWIAKEIAHVEARREQFGLVMIPALSGVTATYLTASGHPEWTSCKHVDLAQFEAAASEIVLAVEGCRDKRARADIPALARAADGVAAISAEAALETVDLRYRLPEAARSTQWLIACRIADRHGLLRPLLEAMVSTTRAPWDPRIPFLLSRGTLTRLAAYDRAWADGRVAELRAATGDERLVETICFEALRRVSSSLWRHASLTYDDAEMARAIARAPRRWIDEAGTFVDTDVAFALAAHALSSLPAIEVAIEASGREDLVLLATVARWSEGFAGTVIARMEKDLGHSPSELTAEEIDRRLEMQGRRLRILADASVARVRELQGKVIDWALRAGRDRAVPAILGDAAETDLATWAGYAEGVPEETRRSLLRAVIALAAPDSDLSQLPLPTRCVVESVLYDVEETWDSVAGDDRALLLWCAVAGPDLTDTQKLRLTALTKRPQTGPTAARLASEARDALARDPSTL